MFVLGLKRLYHWAFVLIWIQASALNIGGKNRTKVLSIKVLNYGSPRSGPHLSIKHILIAHFNQVSDVSWHQRSLENLRLYCCTKFLFNIFLAAFGISEKIVHFIGTWLLLTRVNEACCFSVYSYSLWKTYEVLSKLTFELVFISHSLLKQ